MKKLFTILFVLIFTYSCSSTKTTVSPQVTKQRVHEVKEKETPETKEVFVRKNGFLLNKIGSNIVKMNKSMYKIKQSNKSEILEKLASSKVLLLHAREELSLLRKSQDWKRKKINFMSLISNLEKNVDNVEFYF